MNFIKCGNCRLGSAEQLRLLLIELDRELVEISIVYRLSRAPDFRICSESGNRTDAKLAALIFTARESCKQTLCVVLFQNLNLNHRAIRNGFELTGELLTIETSKQPNSFERHFPATDRRSSANREEQNVPAKPDENRTEDRGHPGVQLAEG